jgi:hypothetical protein
MKACPHSTQVMPCCGGRPLQIRQYFCLELRMVELLMRANLPSLCPSCVCDLCERNILAQPRRQTMRTSLGMSS